MQVPATPKSCESLTAFLQSLDSTKDGSEVRVVGGESINSISQSKLQFDLTHHISIFSAECTIRMVLGAAIH